MIANFGSAVYKEVNNALSWKSEEDAVRRYWKVIKNSNPYYRKQKENKKHRGKKQLKNKDYYELAEKYEDLYKKLKKYKKKWFDNWENNKNKTIEYQTETHQIREKIMDFVYEWYISMTKKYNNKKHDGMAKKLRKLEPLACLLIDIRDLVKIRYNLRIDGNFENISEEKKKKIEYILSKCIDHLNSSLEDYIGRKKSNPAMMYLPPFDVIRSRKLIWFIEKNGEKYYVGKNVIFIGENGERINLFNSEERLTYALCVEISKRIKERWEKENPNQ